MVFYAHHKVYSGMQVTMLLIGSLVICGLVIWGLLTIVHNRAISPIQPIEASTVVKTIQVDSDTKDPQQALTQKSNHYLYLIRNLDQYTVKTSLVNEHTWVLTLNQRGLFG